MANPTSGAETLKAWLARYQELQALCDLLERLGSLEQVEAETKARITAAKEGEKQAQDALAGAQHKIVEAKTAAAHILENAQAHATQITAEAGRSAGVIIATAQSKADGMVAGAKEEAAKITAAANAAHADILARANRMIEAGVRENIEKLRQQREAEDKAISVKMAEAQARLDDLNRNIEKAKAAARAILG